MPSASEVMSAMPRASRTSCSRNEVTASGASSTSAPNPSGSHRSGATRTSLGSLSSWYSVGTCATTSRGITKGSEIDCRNCCATSGATSEAPDRSGEPGPIVRVPCRRKAPVSVLAHVRRDGAGRHQVGDRLHGLTEDLVDRVQTRQRLGEPQQRRRGLRRLALGLEELRVADRDRRVRGQHLEQPAVLLVELPVPEARQHDRADRLGRRPASAPPAWTRGCRPCRGSRRRSRPRGRRA